MVDRLNYETLKKKLEQSCKKEESRKRKPKSVFKEEARRTIIQAKRDERETIQDLGGGHTIARMIMSKDTDFNPDEFEPGEKEFNDKIRNAIDERIERESKERCMETVTCFACGTVHGYCTEIKDDKEKLKMLPDGNEAKRGRSNNKGGMNWIKTETLSTTPEEAKILMVRYNEEGQFGAQVELKLAFKGQIYFWGLRPQMKNSPNYRLLKERFGSNENDWVDQRILLLLEQDQFSGRYFPRVDFPEEQKPELPVNTPPVSTRRR
jgi:hypothetical protein